MNSNVALPKEVPPQLTFPPTPGGLGTCRSTGDILTLFLSLEPPEDRAQIIAWSAIDLGVSLDELVAAYTSR